MQKLKLGITIGDINGISPEIIIKSLSDDRLLDLFTPIIYGSSKVIAYHKNIVKKGFSFNAISQAQDSLENKVNVLNCWEENVNITLGDATKEGGKFAHIALDRAVRDFTDNKIDGIVTAPINKYAMKMSGFSHPGHTEYLEDKFSGHKSLMMMISSEMKLGLVTNHLPISKVSESITKERVMSKIKTMHSTLRQDFGIDEPLIAVLGLNPHAGDRGSIGSEDEEIVKSVIIEAKENGIMAMGPYAADGFFGSAQYKKFDAILAMYHDQGLVPFKALSFGNGVNFTAGLPIVRTSPDHGTAYDIAGKNQADESSLIHAIYRAIDISKHRFEYNEMRENALAKS